MVKAYKIWGMGTDDLTGITPKMLALSATINATGASFKEGASNYAVTAGKSFYVTGFHHMYSTNHAHTGFLCYADDSNMATNRVAMGLTYPSSLSIALGNLQPANVALNIPAPAGKYVGIYNAAAVAWLTTTVLFGYEV